jgi:hypothetical protein
VRIKILFISVMFVTMVYADSTFIDYNLKISATLTSAWEKVDVTDSSCMFISFDPNYTSNIFILKKRIPDTMTAREWTEAHFIAYKLFVESSSEPFGTLLWYDSTTAAALQGVIPEGTAWAPWLYSTFKSIDMTDIFVWAEYERYCAWNECGYEMYVMGDTSDMTRNFSVYAGFLQGIKLLDSPNISVLPDRDHGVSAHRTIGPTTRKNQWYNLRGQSIGGVSRARRSQGVICSVNKKIVTIFP